MIVATISYDDEGGPLVDRVKMILCKIKQTASQVGIVIATGQLLQNLSNRLGGLFALQIR